MKPPLRPFEAAGCEWPNDYSLSNQCISALSNPQPKESLPTTCSKEVCSLFKELPITNVKIVKYPGII